VEHRQLLHALHEVGRGHDRIAPVHALFVGNCVILGIPCLVATEADLEWLQEAVARAPQTLVTVDVERQEVCFSGRVMRATLPDGARHQLGDGTWDSTAMLLAAGATIEATARKLALRRVTRRASPSA
jgi:3-isopropylmalate/(R)-2-methylmalate dehydratase small subunit